MFVGTKLREENDIKATKISDFESRFTMPIIKLHNGLFSDTIKIMAEFDEKDDSFEDVLYQKKYKEDDINNIIKELIKKNINTSDTSLDEKFIKKVNSEIKDITTENIYYSVSFIRGIFESVTELQYGCFKIFSHISPTVSVRQIRKFIESLEGIAFERMTVDNMLELIGKEEYKKQMQDLFGVKRLGIISNPNFVKKDKYYEYVAIEDEPK